LSDFDIDINELFHDESILCGNMHEFVIDRSVIFENNMILEIILRRQFRR